MNTLILSLFFGVIGTAYFMYGKRQQAWPTLIAGVGLCVFPYFISDLRATLVIGLLLMALPWLWR